MVINKEFWNYLDLLHSEDIVLPEGESPMMHLPGLLKNKVEEIESMVRFMHTDNFDQSEFVYALGEVIILVSKLSCRFNISFDELLFYLQTAVYVEIEKRKDGGMQDGD